MARITPAMSHDHEPETAFEKAAAAELAAGKPTLVADQLSTVDVPTVATRPETGRALTRERRTPGHKNLPATGARREPVRCARVHHLKRRDSTVFLLRSHPVPRVADAIPRRLFSSSLPPSFVSGRFAATLFHRLNTLCVCQAILIR